MSEHIEYKSVQELSTGCQRALYDLLLVLADSKHLLGLRYGEWLGAPALEASIAAVAMAQDELGHARLLYGLLDEFIKAGFPKRKEEPSQYRNIECLDQAFSSWADFVTANLLVDLALTVQLEAFQRSSYLPLRQRAPKILQEERFHFQHAKGWLVRLASSEKTKAELERSIKQLWGTLLAWFGKVGSVSERALVEAGIQATDSDGLRHRFLEKIGPLLQQAHLDLPVWHDAITGQWLIEAPSWDGWDEAFRRFTRTGPDAATFTQIESLFIHEYPVE